MNKKVYESSLLGESYTKYTHSSGLDLYIFPKKMSSSFALFGAKYGSIHNSFNASDGKTVCVPDGIAHFLEHKLFVCEDGSDAFERFSALGADANAYTTFNRTAYHFTCTDSFYDSLCELVDFVSHPYFTPETVASEIGIISEEISMYDDNPADRCFYGMLGGMYHEHSTKKNICGSHSSIREITADTLYECYRVFYRPDNLVLIICGDVDEHAVLEVVDKYLPDTAPTDRLCKINENEREPKEVAKAYVEQKMPVSKPMFYIGFKDTDIPSSPAERQYKDACMAIVNEVLFSRSGEFYASLFESHLISPSLSYGYTICETFAYNSISGEADDPKKVLDKICEHIEQAKLSGLDRDEFERAKRVMYAESVRTFDSVEGIGNALFSNAAEGTELFYQTELFGSITYEQAQLCFDSFFSDPQITLSVVSPCSH